MVKNIKDARYQQNELLIQASLVKQFRAVKDKVTFNVTQFCKKFGIPVRTFRDHGGVNGQLRRISSNVARDMRAIAKDNVEHRHDAHHLYFTVMRYMKENQKYFEINQKRHSAVLWEVTFKELKPALEQIWRTGYGQEKDEIIYVLYRGEISGIFSLWEESGFSDMQFFDVLKRIERLTIGALTRLVKYI